MPLEQYDKNRTPNSFSQEVFASIGHPTAQDGHLRKHGCRKLTFYRVVVEGKGFPGLGSREPCHTVLVILLYTVSVRVSYSCSKEVTAQQAAGAAKG